MENFVQTVLYPALGSALAILAGLAMNALIDFLKRQAASSKHFSAAGIVFDSVKASFNAKILPSIQAKLADGKMTDAEFVALKNEVKQAAKGIAMDNLKNLRGFLPKDLNRWVEIQMEIALGEVFGVTSNGEDEETDPLAVTPASPEDSR